MRFLMLERIVEMGEAVGGGDGGSIKGSLVGNVRSRGLEWIVKERFFFTMMLGKGVGVSAVSVLGRPG
jgi:hypothetical protein